MTRTVGTSNLDVDELFGMLLRDAAAASPALDGRRIARVTRTPAPYSSSYRMEEVEVAFDDGGCEWFVLKDLSHAALLDGARRAKPPFLFDPGREIETYRHVLVPHGIPAPAVVGLLADESRQVYLLLLERVPGAPLWQVGDLHVWHEAARSAATMHARLAGAAPSLVAPARLLCYDAPYYRRWRERAEAMMKPARADTRVHRVLRAYEQIIQDLLNQPRTFIHGEYHASNIVAGPAAAPQKVTSVDWEMAALGPGLMDLADLTAGKWTDCQRQSIVSSYRAAAASGAMAAPDFDRALDRCRLHRAVQWLAWSDDWRPPREHAQDWLGEALRLCDRLGAG